jgi:hypothetical protein
MAARRFPPPWTIDEANDACSSSGTPMGTGSPTSISMMTPADATAAGLLTRDEARRIAINVAKLPDVLRAPEKQSPVS